MRMPMQEVVSVISDAFMLSEMDDVSAAAAMAGTHQGLSDPSKAVEQLRSTCLSMLCAAMQWDLFRCTNGALSNFSVHEMALCELPCGHHVDKSALVPSN